MRSETDFDTLVGDDRNQRRSDKAVGVRALARNVNVDNVAAGGLE